jgi:hypothetical protein
MIIGGGLPYKNPKGIGLINNLTQRSRRKEMKKISISLEIGSTHKKVGLAIYDMRAMRRCERS